MSLLNIMNIAGSAMAAQTTRLNVVASNLSNQDTISADKDKVYHARSPVFETLYQDMQDGIRSGVAGVKVSNIIESETELRREYQPGNPLADDEGYVFMPNVNPIEEMADMISASRSYQDNVQVIETAKNLALRTIQSIEDR